MIVIWALLLLLACLALWTLWRDHQKERAALADVACLQRAAANVGEALDAAAEDVARAAAEVAALTASRARGVRADTVTRVSVLLEDYDVLGNARPDVLQPPSLRYVPGSRSQLTYTTSAGQREDLLALFEEIVAPHAANTSARRRRRLKLVS